MDYFSAELLDLLHTAYNTEVKQMIVGRRGIQLEKVPFTGATINGGIDKTQQDTCLPLSER